MNTRILDALQGKAADRPPIWFMRQAGRYLPEYREVRAKVSFLELCADPDLCLEVTRQPVDRYGLDAAIVFSDILPVISAIGREIEFGKGTGPKVLRPLRDVSEVPGLLRPDVSDALPVVPETIRRWRKLRPEIPILGFAGAPFTLFCYLVEGGGSRNWENAKRMLWTHPKESTQVLELLADVVGDYLQLQAEAGAVAVQLFDTWAGALSCEDYQRFALPAAQRALARVDKAPRIFFTKDTAPFLHLLPQLGADAYGVDWRTDLGRARAALGPEVPVQGNLDPIALFAPPDEIRAAVRRVIRQAGPKGHIFNLGHGITPKTPLEGVQAMVDAVKEFSFASEG